MRACGLNSNETPHYLDHLGPICTIMDIPLVVVEEKIETLARTFYPDLKVQTLPYEQLTPGYLHANYDAVFVSDYWGKEKFSFRIVHCPHGYSDKGFYLFKCAFEDIVLIYGQKMLDLLEDFGVRDELKHYAMTGNYRYSYFKKHQAFYEKIVNKKILSQFAKKQPLILYAPTWLDSEESTTFFDAAKPILENLPDNYNMLVKLHPRLEFDNVAEYYHIIGTFQDKPNIVFVEDFPPVYPLLEHTDIYLGDTSSVGYDFLVYNRPMFFLKKESRPFLFKCGTEVTPDTFYNVIKQDQKILSPFRKEIYKYTFGDEQTFDEIKKNILQSLSE